MGDENPINKPLSFAERFDRVLNVTAVIEDLPSNSHLDISAIMSNDALSDSSEMAGNPWDMDVSTNLYIKFDGQSKPEDFAKKANSLLQIHIARRDDGSEKRFTVFLQPLSEIYLGPDQKMEFCKKGDPLYVYIFAGLGIFLLIIAGINYINLSIADLNSRLKEIGVRKILGAQKKQIIFQVSLEALFFCCSGLLIGTTLLYILFPEILQLLEPNLLFGMLLNRPTVAVIVLSMLFLVLLTALYPSIRFSTESPAFALKGLSTNGRKSDWGKNLLFAQFTISIVCICATIVVGYQVHFIRNTNLGYDRHNVVSLLMPDRYPFEKAPGLKAKLAGLAGVESVSFSYYAASGATAWKDWYLVEMDGEMKKVLLSEIFIDHDFLKTLNIQIVLGRNFDPGIPSDVRTAFLVNETAVKKFGWENPIGKRIKMGSDKSDSSRWEGTVIGVTRDFNKQSLRERIEPLIMRLPWDNWPGYWLHIKVRGSVSETILAIKSTYESVLPGYLIDYRMVEDVYDQEYQNESKAFTSLQLGTLIILIISAFGIFSLSVYMSIQRMKEFGIRKVLGASTAQISFLHMGRFMRIALLANLVALPTSYWMMSEWLETFAYRTALNGYLFLEVACISIGLVIVSAGYSSWRAGRMNPVDVIKAQ